jgi:O-antigen/teichoic acid export membrane protein
MTPRSPTKPLPEAATVRSYGGEVRIIPLVEGQSTSAIEQRIIERWRAIDPSARLAPAMTAATGAPSERSQIARGAAIIMVGTMLSRILGLVREQITSWLFGTGDAVAAFTIADNIHTMLFDLVISGMMQAALVPVLSAYATKETRDELRKIVGALLMLALLIVGGAVVVAGDCSRRRWSPS